MFRGRGRPQREPMSVKKTFIAAALATLVLSGCGPGFPIMTKEQDDLVRNVETLMKENDSMKARVAKLEGSGGLESVKRDMESVKRAVAEANIGVERLGQDISAVRGSLEEGSNDRDSIKNAVKDAQTLSASLKDKLASIEAAIVSSQQRIATLEGQGHGNGQRLTEMRDAIAQLESKTNSLEKGLSSAKAESSSRHKESAKEASTDEAETLYQKGYTETTAKDYSKAVMTFQKFLSSYPEHKFAPNAQYWLGEIYYAKGDWEMAILEFDKVIKKYPAAEKTPASLLKQGFAFEKLGSRREAKVLLQEVVEKYPKTSEAAAAKKRLSEIKN